MNEFEPGVFNSGLILNYLLRKKTSFTIYLEDGVKLTGTLLGWDSDFLLIKDGNFLQMVRLGKITRLQAELEQVLAVDNVSKQDDYSNQSSIEITKSDSSSNIIFSKYKPTLTEVKTPPSETTNNNSSTNSREEQDSKNRLDQLVKNW